MRVNINGVDYAPMQQLPRPEATLGDILRRARTQLRMTMEVASIEAKCARSHLHRIEMGGSMPGLDIAYRLAKLYGIPLETLGLSAQERKS